MTNREIATRVCRMAWKGNGVSRTACSMRAVERTLSAIWSKMKRWQFTRAEALAASGLSKSIFGQSLHVLVRFSGLFERTHQGHYRMVKPGWI